MSLRIVLDSKSELTIRTPRKDANILQLGANYLAHEASLPPESQNPMPPLLEVQAAYQAARDAADRAAAGEHDRAVAALTCSQVLNTIQDRLQWAINGRARAFAHNLNLIEAWGVDTVMGARERIIAYPDTVAGWVSLLDSYIAKEESLLPEDQWTDPPLSDFETWREQYQTSYQARELGLLQRRQGTEERSELAAVLKEQLMLALHVILLRQFGGKIRTSLAAWGFDVRTRHSNGSSEPEPAPAETTSEPEPVPAG